MKTDADEVVVLRGLADDCEKWALHAQSQGAMREYEMGMRGVRAYRLMADVLAQDAALVERMARAIDDDPRIFDANPYRRSLGAKKARAALAAMLQKDAPS